MVIVVIWPIIAITVSFSAYGCLRTKVRWVSPAPTSVGAQWLRRWTEKHRRDKDLREHSASVVSRLSR